MMTSGVHPIQAHHETINTENKLERLKTKNESCLPESGPAIIPLHGKGGSPVKLANRRPSAKEINMNLY